MAKERNKRKILNEEGHAIHRNSPRTIRQPTRYVAQPNDNTRKNCAEAVRGTENKTYKMTVKSTGADPPDTIKQILKSKINPGEIKVGIRTFKSFSGGVLIETNSEAEIEILGKEIQAKCGRELEAHVHSLRKPRLIILSVPEYISTTNIEDSILRQNPELNLKKDVSLPSSLTSQRISTVMLWWT